MRQFFGSIGFTGDFGSGKTYLLIRWAIETALLDAKKDGTPVPRRIISDTKLNARQVTTFGTQHGDDFIRLPEPGQWEKPQDLLGVQDSIIVMDEGGIRFDARKGAEQALSSDIRTVWFQQRHNDLSFGLSFQRPRYIDVTFRDLLQLGIWWVEPLETWFNYGRRRDYCRPDKVNPRTGRLQVLGDNRRDWLGRATGFRALRVDLFDFAKPKQDWKILDEFTCRWNPAVAAAYDTDADVVVQQRQRTIIATKLQRKMTLPPNPEGQKAFELFQKQEDEQPF